MRLRQWALRLLARRDPPDPPRDLCDAVDAWRLFLRVERCAHPLAQRLANTKAALSLEVLADLRRGAEREARLALMAKAQLDEIGLIAHSLELPVAVLKGGLRAARESPIHLGDIDLLVPLQQVGVLTDALRRRGYRRAGWSSPRHVEALVRPGQLRLEIHTTLERDGSPAPANLWDEIEPLNLAPGLWRLSPGRHLEHLLIHVGVDHPSRRGRLRDLLLLAEALADTRARGHGAAASHRDARETGAVGSSRGGFGEGGDPPPGTAQDAGGGGQVTRQEATFGGLLRMAAALDEGRESEDLFARTALSNYALLALLGPLELPRSLSETILKWTFALLEGPAELEAVWGDALAVSMSPSPYRPLAGLERAFPSLGRGARLALRQGRLAAALAIAAPLALAISREIERPSQAAEKGPTGCSRGAPDEVVRA